MLPAMGAPPVASIVALAQQLVRIPTRAGDDPPLPLLEQLGSWLAERGLAVEEVRDEAGVQGLAARVAGTSPGPALVLNATVDTAPFGDPATWTGSPTSGDVRDGWLHGRGAADSKAGVALFSHVGARFAAEPEALAGELVLLFDAGEHSGQFSGVRAFFEGDARPEQVAGVLIGYPGDGQVVVGSRGFLRASVHVRGRAAHSGGVSQRGQNAVVKAAALVAALEARRAELPAADDFPLPPELTVTGIAGGESFSIVPDRCRVDVDLRLTPGFGVELARELLVDAVARLDEQRATDEPSRIDFFGGWPAFRLEEGSRLMSAMREATRKVLGEALPTRVVGPSNAGNYVATLGIEATAGFGVRYRNLHAADEAFEVSSLAPAYAVYEHAVRAILAPG